MKKTLGAMACITLVAVLISVNIAPVYAAGLSSWFNTEVGSEFANAGITTYYVNDDVSSPNLLMMPLNVPMPNRTAPWSDPSLTIVSQIKLNDVNVGEGAVRIAENKTMHCSFHITNNTAVARTLTIVIATYTAGNILYRATPLTVSLEASGLQTCEVIYSFVPEYEYTGKIMFWDSLAGMVPMRATIDFSKMSGINAYYYDINNRLLQIDKANGDTISYTYDNSGNLLQKSVVKAGESNE